MGKEYIEREAVFDVLFGQFCASSDETEQALNAAIEEFKSIPAADIVPVARAKWEVIDQEEPRRYICTNCHCLSWGEYNFCHHCGARMDGDGDV